jgi:hypothetical protein
LFLFFFLEVRGEATCENKIQFFFIKKKRCDGVKQLIAPSKERGRSQPYSLKPFIGMVQIRIIALHPNGKYKHKPSISAQAHE